MTQHEQTQQARAIQALLYTFYTVVFVVVLALVIGIHITAFEIIAVSIGAMLAYPFMYWATGWVNQ